MRITDKNKAKKARLARRKNRVRAKVFGTSQRPRLAVFRSLSHISAQLIDDTTGTTLAAVMDTELKKKGTKTELAQEVGKAIAKKAQDKKITSVVFDRGGRIYHGRVKALADAAREAGLEF